MNNEIQLSEQMKNIQINEDNLDKIFEEEFKKLEEEDMISSLFKNKLDVDLKKYEEKQAKKAFKQWDKIKRKLEKESKKTKGVKKKSKK